MLPWYLKVIYPQNSSIHIRYDRVDYFDNPWHFHPELEVNLILQGRGTRFVGNHVEKFQPGDLVFLGSNTPHYWKTNARCRGDESTSKCEAIILKFSEYFLGINQYDVPELSPLKNFFELAKRGIRFRNYDRKIQSRLKKMVHIKGLERIGLFLEILDLIYRERDYYYLCSEGFLNSINPRDEKRMNEVYNFMINHFQEKISIDQIAEKAHMNPSAFSRYFKQRTGKSVTAFLQDMRIGYACRLLIQTSKNISEIILESGLYNQAYFNRLFCARMNCTPREYRRKYKNEQDYFSF
ncbi:MAG: AraC family transcriptional regulator [Bacteroidales bacterium]|nr:AraC family transcriptional regulator [Bacteroidales bacterium]MBS3775192.1 AraC family transcriptional regulator [Bacteroidales bacterium]